MRFTRASFQRLHAHEEALAYGRRCGRILAGLLLSLTLAACSRPAGPDDANAGDAVAQAQPADEVAFLAVKTSTEADYDQAPNDIIKSQVKAGWKTAVCTAIKTPAFANWTGHVAGILSDGGFIVNIGDNVEVQGSTAPGSPVFQAISGLSEGEAVKISGRFNPEDDGSCMVKTDGFPFGDAPIKKPAFEVSFSNVAPF